MRLAGRRISPADETLRVLPAELGGEAGLVGAALVGFEALDGAWSSSLPLAVCATPIGNLGDVTLRVLEELREADLVLCEDTRRSRILLDRYGISSRLQSFHGHNEAARAAGGAGAARA